MKPSFVLPLVVSLFAAACGHGTAAPAAPASPEAQKLVLGADPGAAEGVVRAKTGGARKGVVVVGRIADVVRGKVAFTLMDTEVPYCGETDPNDHCKTPWDYCCETKERRAANSLFVEARGADGKPIASPGLPEMRLLDRVAVKGDIVVDEHGNPVLVAAGLFRLDRPKLADDLTWPQ